MNNLEELHSRLAETETALAQKESEAAALETALDTTPDVDGETRLLATRSTITRLQAQKDKLETQLAQQEKRQHERTLQAEQADLEAAYEKLVNSMYARIVKLARSFEQEYALLMEQRQQAGDLFERHRAILWQLHGYQAVDGKMTLGGPWGWTRFVPTEQNVPPQPDLPASLNDLAQLLTWRMNGITAQTANLAMYASPVRAQEPSQQPAETPQEPEQGLSLGEQIARGRMGK